jgi:hypothetical protein
MADRLAAYYGVRFTVAKGRDKAAKERQVRKGT